MQTRYTGEREHPSQAVVKEAEMQTGWENKCHKFILSLNFMHFWSSKEHEKDKTSTVATSLSSSLFFPFIQNYMDVSAFLPQRSLEIEAWEAINAPNSEVNAPELLASRDHFLNTLSMRPHSCLRLCF